MNIKDATRKWVSEFNAIPTAMIERLVASDEVEWEFYLPDGEYEPIPMWGSMWSFDDWTDNEWVESYGGLDALLECGFTVLHHDEFGYYFGINGAGYDFYEAHWIPLYKMRGLKWHDIDVDDYV